MSTEKRVRWALVGFPLAGLVSALVSVWVHPHLFGHEDFLGGIVFGGLLTVCFWVFLGLRSMWKTAVFVIVSAAAAYVSFFAAFFAQGAFQTQSHLPAIFVGGLIGAFIIVSAALFLVSPRLRVSQLPRVLGKCFCWALAGGLMGVIGMVAAPAFHGFRMWLAPYSTDDDVSLIFVWQTGMALMLALILWFEKDRHEAAGRATA